MPLTAVDSFVVDSTKAYYIPVPTGQKATVANTGNTLYYKSTSDVTSGSSDGSIATASTAAFTKGQFVRTATGVATNVTVTTESGFEGPGGQARQFAPIHTWIPVAATTGTDTAFADGTLFLASVTVPGTMLATGIGYQVGSVGGTDGVIVILYDAAGNPVANSTVAGTPKGTTAGTAAQTQSIAFTGTVVVPGPAKYYLGVQASGNTAKLRTVIAYTSAGLQAGSVSQTHGTVAKAVMPTTFTADKAPIAFLY